MKKTLKKVYNTFHKINNYRHADRCALCALCIFFNMLFLSLGNNLPLSNDDLEPKMLSHFLAKSKHKSNYKFGYL